MDETNQEPQISIEHIYIKDLSLESPNAPEIFREKWKPEIKLDITDEHQKLDDTHYEVSLNLTVKAMMSNADKMAFLVQIKQVGIFSLHSIPEDNMNAVLGAFCPATLYPYARQVIASQVAHAGFPPLHLVPINFDALHAEKQKATNKD